MSNYIKEFQATTCMVHLKKGRAVAAQEAEICVSARDDDREHIKTEVTLISIHDEDWGGMVVPGLLFVNIVSQYFPCVIHNLFSSFNLFSRPYFDYFSVLVKYESMHVNNHWVEHRLWFV